PPPPMRRSSTAYSPTEHSKPGDYTPLPMLTPAPTPVRNLIDHPQAPPPRMQRSLTTGTTRGQMSPWAHYGSDQGQQRAGPPPPLLLESGRLRNVSPYHLAQRSPAVGDCRTPTQYSAQFLARSLAASPASPWAQSPQRSLSRRQSIVLQSSCSGHLSLESPKRSSVPPLLPSAAGDPQSQASTKSLPHGPSAVVDAQRSRRRSMAYERYPPLVSIFEASAARSLAYDVEPYGEEEDPQTACEGRIVARTPSATSLASEFSALPSPSSSSSSSSVSSYSYLFDTARPPPTAIATGEFQIAHKQSTGG
ncbi:hypothetical protein FBU31_007737, partial [Coemansia sp. 'formosensis']